MGAPKSPVKPGGAIDRLMDTFPNIYGDLSAGSGANAISRDPVFGREFLIRRQDRLMFGTDYLQPGQPVPQFQILASLKLPAPMCEKKIASARTREKTAEAQLTKDNAGRTGRAWPLRSIGDGSGL